MSVTGQRIKERRTQLEMSADDVAARLGVSRSTIFRYENGHIGKVPANVLEKLAGILKTTPAYLMGWQDECAEYQHSGWVHGSLDTAGESFFREDDGKGYHTDTELETVIQHAHPDDMKKIIAMAKLYFTLTDSGKRKAYDYLIDLSEQPKYRKQFPDAVSPVVEVEKG
nr:helix-turn-helix transcriptional regulator [uncultured Clostridium sp.]